MCKFLKAVLFFNIYIYSERENSEGYPMSRFVNSRENGDLSYTAKEMACHALEGYSSRLMMGVDQLKVLILENVNFLT